MIGHDFRLILSKITGVIVLLVIVVSVIFYVVLFGIMFYEWLRESQKKEKSVKESPKLNGVAKN